jgi:hypothetical protein
MNNESPPRHNGSVSSATSPLGTSPHDSLPDCASGIRMRDELDALVLKHWARAVRICNLRAAAV